MVIKSSRMVRGLESRSPNRYVLQSIEPQWSSNYVRVSSMTKIGGNCSWEISCTRDDFVCHCSISKTIVGFAFSFIIAKLLQSKDAEVMFETIQ